MNSVDLLPKNLQSWIHLTFWFSLTLWSSPVFGPTVRSMLM